MRLFSISAIVAASASLLAPSVQAADLPIGGPGPLTINEFVSNWYLRGDIGYQFTASPSGGGFSNAALSDAPSFDIGFGYREGWLRADVTVNYPFQPRFSGAIGNAPDITSHINAVTILFNGYVDLGTWYGLTPYVGGGVGFSWMRSTDLTPASQPNGSGTTGDLAFDLTAGVSYPLSRNLLIDASYRFIHIGYPVINLPPYGVVETGSMDSHEIRTGLRYQID